ncbi:PREDICTED: tectonic-3-like [Wasmannia auropunctata]|uniref:tectonic-3-like n=1 Tax=Wasmannia auropunctata TaxID=64793 RepID=UPI0005EEC69B|nr:PREDICTED: tectonic-3-like [Wasmannia auropunctata]
MKNYKWKTKHSKILSKYNLSKYYQYGDVLWKLHDKSVETIEFLQSGFSGICTFKKILRYLQNWKGACIQNKLTNINPYLFTVIFSNFTVIKSPPLFNATFITNQICQSNICLPVRTYYCLKSFSACSKTNISGFCMNSTCINIVKGLKYVIGHNGSTGINNIDVYFNIGNVSHAFYQYFEIEYNWIDSNNTKMFTGNGNPGYMRGKPIIIGVFHTNKSDDIFFNKTNGFFTLPLAGKNGECDQINRHTVLFGENTKLTCSVKLFIKNFTASSCTELQNLTMRFLIKDFLNISQYNNIYISKQGNFSSKNIIDWLHVVFDRIPQNIMTAHTIGKRIFCSGLVTSMHLNVLYSMLPKPKTITNYKISGVGITFSKEEDISWPKCTLKNCTDVLYINIISYVNFYDVSKPSKYYFAGGPNLDITLPYDFFYPFLNGSKIIEIPNILIILIIYVLWSIYIKFLLGYPGTPVIEIKCNFWLERRVKLWRKIDLKNGCDTYAESFHTVKLNLTKALEYHEKLEKLQKAFETAKQLLQQYFDDLGKRNVSQDDPDNPIDVLNIETDKAMQDFKDLGNKQEIDIS